MTESEYITATNRVKISIALNILHDVLPGENNGITDEQLKEIMKPLKKAEDKLFMSYRCKSE